MDKAINTLEGFLYQQLINGVSKETLQQFLMDELDEAVDMYETENAYREQINDLSDALLPFYAYIKKYYPSLVGKVDRPEFEESLMSFLLKLKKDPAYVKLFFTTFTGKEIEPIEVKDDEKIVYNFLKSNNLN